MHLEQHGLLMEAEMTFQAALMAGVIPFIIGDIAKMIVAIIVAPMIKNPFSKSRIYQIRRFTSLEVQYSWLFNI